MGTGTTNWGRSMELGRNRVLLVAIALVFIAVYAWLHLRAAFTLPLPWPDEPDFLWPAIALARDGSLLAPEMNRELHMMWMPPGFMVFTAGWIWLFGFSLELVRALSAALIVTFFCAIVLMLRRHQAPLASTLLCGLFLLDAHFVAAGNVGRMEALLLAVLGLGLWRLSRDDVITGMCVLSITPIIHPNGLYFVLASLLFVVISGLAAQRWRDLRRSELQGSSRISPLEWLSLLVVLACWLSYATYVAFHFDEFTFQIGAQLQRKLERSNDLRTLRLSDYALAVSLTTAFVYGLVQRERGRLILLLSCVAAGSWTCRFIGGEMWYQIFYQVTLLFTSLCLLELGSRVLSRALPNVPKLLLTAGLLLVLLAGLFGTRTLPFPPGLPDRLSFYYMRTAPSGARVDPWEMDQVAAKLRRFGDCRERVVIRVDPPADALFLYERLSDTNLLFSTPPWLLVRAGNKDSRYRVPRWDIFVVHVDRYVFPFARQMRKMAQKAAGIEPGSDEKLLIRNNADSAWYLNERERQTANKCGSEQDSIRNVLEDRGRS